MDVNPIILERESPFSNKWLSMFSFNELIDYFDEIESIEVKMESLKEEIINDLEDLIGETSGDIKLTLINLKRNLYNNRKIKLPENTTSLDSHEAWSNIKREIKKLAYFRNKSKVKREELDSVLKENFIKERRSLWKEAKSNIWMKNALNFLSPNSIISLKNYLETNVDEHRSKEKKLDYLLLKVLTRASTKTSPFSTLTRNCITIRDIEKEQFNKVEYKETEKIYTQVNYKLLLEYYEELKYRDIYFKGLSFFINDTTLVFDNILYVTSLVNHKDKPKVFETTDLLQKFKINNFLSDLIDIFKTNSSEFLTYQEIFDELETKGHKNIHSSLKFFAKKKVILTKENLKEEYNIIDNLLELISPCQEDKLINNVVMMLKEVKERIRKINEIPFNSDEEIYLVRKKLKEINKLLNIDPIPQKNFLVQDYFLNQLKESINLSERQVQTLKKILYLIKIFDGELYLQLLIGDWISKKYGTDFISIKKNVNVIKEIVNIIIQNVDNISNLNLSPLNLNSEILFLTKLSEVRNQFIEMVIRSDARKTINISEDILDNMISNMDFLKEYDSSNSFFFQVNKDKKLVINNIYTGYLSYFNRFLYFYPEVMDIPTVKSYLNFLNEEKRIADIFNIYGFNANIRPNITEKVIQIPNKTVNFDKENQKCIQMDELTLKIDEELGILKFYEDKNKKEIKPIFMGSVIKSAIPSIAATLDTLSNNGSLQLSLSKQIINYHILKDDFFEKKIPEVTVSDTVILSREKYIFKFEVFKNARKLEDIEKLKWLVQFFRDKGMGQAFFVSKATIKESSERKYVEIEKPQYYNFTSISFCRLFFRENKSSDYVVFEKCNPEIKENTVTEYLAEITN